MSPRAPQFTESQITAAALEILREQGWGTLTARAIATRLGTSTTPIYSVFASMDDIEAAVRVEAMGRQLHYMLTPRSDNPLLDLALGYVAFARDERMFFRFLFIDRPVPASAALRQQLEGRGFVDRLREILPDNRPADLLDTYFGGRSASSTNEVAYRSWIFAHGLAMLLCSGTLPTTDDTEIRRLLEGAGYAFTLLQRESAPASPTEDR